MAPKTKKLVGGGAWLVGVVVLMVVDWRIGFAVLLIVHGEFLGTGGMMEEVFEDWAERTADTEEEDDGDV